MMGRRLAAFVLLAAAAAVLRLLGSGPGDALALLRSQGSPTDPYGAEQAVVVVTSMLGWLLVGWLALGLLATLSSELPGGTGRLAGRAAKVLLPATLRQLVALSLGVGLVTGAAPAALADDTRGRPAPSESVDWPVRPSATPQGPTAPRPAEPTGTADRHGAADPTGSGPADAGQRGGTVQVRAGDCLWTLAADRLPPGASDARIAGAVLDWYSRNRTVIGPDPDLILPGQQLIPPAGS